MDGEQDPDEDVNEDGKYNIIDCLPEELQQQVAARTRRTLMRVSETSDLSLDLVKEVDAVCPDGYMAISGGFVLESDMYDWLINVKESYPMDDTTWHVSAEAPVLVDEEWAVTAWAVCDALSD